MVMNMGSSLARKRRGEHGVSLVEAAIVLPIFLIFLYTLVDFAIASYDYIIVNRALAAAVRGAIAASAVPTNETARSCIENPVDSSGKKGEGVARLFTTYLNELFVPSSVGLINPADEEPLEVGGKRVVLEGRGFEAGELFATSALGGQEAAIWASSFEPNVFENRFNWLPLYMIRTEYRPRCVICAIFPRAFRKSLMAVTPISWQVLTMNEVNQGRHSSCTQLPSGARPVVLSDGTVTEIGY